MKIFWACMVAINLISVFNFARSGSLCPIACRIDANGIKGAWYETQLPGFQKTLWVSREQKALIEEVTP